MIINLSISPISIPDMYNWQRHYTTNSLHDSPLSTYSFQFIKTKYLISCKIIYSIISLMSMLHTNTICVNLMYTMSKIPFLNLSAASCLGIGAVAFLISWLWLFPVYIKCHTLNADLQELPDKFDEHASGFVWCGKGYPSHRPIQIYTFENMEQWTEIDVILRNKLSSHMVEYR